MVSAAINLNALSTFSTMKKICCSLVRTKGFNKKYSHYAPSTTFMIIDMFTIQTSLTCSCQSCGLNPDQAGTNCSSAPRRMLCSCSRRANSQAKSSTFAFLTHSVYSVPPSSRSGSTGIGGLHRSLEKYGAGNDGVVRHNDLVYLVERR